MRREHDVGPAQAVRNLRLVLVHVERRAGDVLCFESGDQSGFVHHRTARSVDEESGRLHLGEFDCADQAARFGQQRDVQREEIGLRQHRDRG